MSWGLVLQVLVSGLAAGAAYGLVGMGYSLIYRMTAVLDFAHGDLVNLGIFAFLLALGGGGAVAQVGLPVGILLLAAGVGVAVAMVGAMLLFRLAVEPFGPARAVGWIAATAAAGLLARGLIGAWFSAESYSVPDVLPLQGLGRNGLVDLPGGGVLELRNLAVLGVALALALGFDLFVARSRPGKAMRAAAEAPDTARLSGIDTERLQLLAWAIAGVLTAVAGLLLAPARPVTLQLGVVLGLKGTAAAVLGRLGSARGAVVAGLCLGVLESVVTSLFVPAFHLGSLNLPQLGPLPGMHDVLALLLLVLALALLPGRLRLAAEAPE
ncbi:MAG TPA: branched-chain amino acid ABC transporter permease [Candidatus Dormibacteraeota bacterium]|jgi:branched-subunit amino acid ABC-type transport system permease component|nr:branched-chain amino acid ABC transporter permease [Candidatus Dormibacteraeota bacterium]